ncbi:MAG: sulfide/dihydroorotate dehydrogenase-like FAD/NAD-binding protein [Thermoplasmata archaeon]|nr:sulfide/dihydroorotate dehydrogenase-like FAD/NAD-binding protein [Thermoplasmata archaeon]
MDNEIVEKRSLTPAVDLFVVSAPEIASHCEPGQFVILMAGEKGERVPLTIADFDRDEGTITLISQRVGKSTHYLGTLKAGDRLYSLAGPLGLPAHVHEKYGTVACVGGGVGTAPLYPQARALKAAGNHVIGIIGARTADLLILEEEIKGVSDEFYVTTDDGTKGEKGFVTTVLERILLEKQVDRVIAIGPVLMMKFVCRLTEEFGVKTIVSLNPIMVDGTGMCGACRVTVGGETKFACVDGPDFDGHQVDFEELMERQRFFREEEELAFEKYKQECRRNADG